MTKSNMDKLASSIKDEKDGRTPDEVEADEYGKAIVQAESDGPTLAAAIAAEPARFYNGGATAEEIAAYRAQVAAPPDVVLEDGEEE